jgi:hypothetical protein
MFAVIHRAGGVYIAVLGTAMIASLLALSALSIQRIQNLRLTSSVGVRQAQLNADAAVELALLTMKQNPNWRVEQPNGRWFTDRSTGAGSCSVDVTDPVDNILAGGLDDPVAILGMGASGGATQRVEVMIEPIQQPLGCLRSAIATGDDIDLQNDTLRTDALITADQVYASSSFIFGSVEAIAANGSTYSGTTTLVTSDKRPAMPDWPNVFIYYRANGTALDIGSLAQTMPNLGRNVGFDSDTSYWTGSVSGSPASTIQLSANIDGHTSCLRVTRSSTAAGASQFIDHVVKPGVNYNISIQAKATNLLGNAFVVKLVTKGIGATAQTSASAGTVVLGTNWTDIYVTLTAPSWSGQLEYARITIDTDHVLGRNDPFYIDNLDLREVTTGRFIYRQILSPTVNTLYAGAPTNPQGIYWIDCQGNRLIIERSRILGTLLVVNPGANSCVAEGPIHWEPAVAGYPALLVDADIASNANFSLRATNRGLSEAENEVNFNPAGPPAVPYDFANSLCTATDTSANDIYPSEIRGMVVIRNNLTFQNYPLVRGQVIVGGDIANGSGELEVQYLPDSLLNPPPGFTAPYSYARRPASIRKAAMP